MNPTNPDVAKSTQQRSEFSALKIIHNFSRDLAMEMAKAHRDSEPEELEDPKDSQELSKWAKNKEEIKIHDLRFGYIFDFPYRETSFNDSMGIAIFLAENGNYTQSMAILRLALNTLLASAMKSILVSIPNRIEESDLIKKMFFSKEDEKKEIDREKIDRVDLTQSRKGILSRIKLTHNNHWIEIRSAIKELEDSKIIAKEDKWAKNHLRVHTLQNHCHAKDNVVDRYRIDSMDMERQFDEELWDEFRSIALAILDLKLCFTRRFNKETLDLQFKSYLSKEAKNKSEFFRVSQYVPIFSSNLPPGALTCCIDCKTRTISTSKQKARDFVCGTCKLARN